MNVHFFFRTSYFTKQLQTTDCKVYVFGALLTDLSKAFDCLPYNLLIAKLNAYGFDNNAVRFVYDYLTSRKQRSKMSDAYSSWQEILLGVPQGSMLDHYYYSTFT